jgi:hypothetical protein
VDGGTHLELGDLAVEVSCHDAFTQQLEATHFVSTRLRR